MSIVLKKKPKCNNPYLGEALRLARLGYTVFPCRAGEKIPATPHGLHDASIDHDQIHGWWKRWPNANVAVATTGVVVIDIDTADHRYPGRKMPPAGPKNLTPRGGRHYWFRRPAGKAWRCSAGQLAEQVDVRTDGGYVVVPPSVVGGKSYAWLRALTCPSDELPLPPEWLITELDGISRPRYASAREAANRESANGQMLTQGKRNSGLASIAGTMRSRGMDEGAIAAGLLEHNRSHCLPPLENDEVVAIAESIGRYKPSAQPSAIGHVKRPAGLVNGGIAVLTSLSAVRAKPIRWLWPGYIPRGCVTLLDGDPGLGKSTITIDITSRVTRGWPLPPAVTPSRSQRREPAGVLLLSAEDDLAHTIRPRLDAAGADVSRVYHLDAIRTDEGERPPVLPWDLALVESHIAQHSIRLVVIDPLMAYLDGGIDSHRDHDVRRCLHALKMIAERTGAAILLVRHLNKLAAGPALYRGGGSIGITGAARSVLVVGRDPQDQERRILAVSKCNLAETAPSLGYAIEREGESSRIDWGGDVELTADDILDHPRPQRQSAGQQCAEAIRELLADGPMDSHDFGKVLRDRGFGANAQRDGRKTSKVQSRREGYGADGRWVVFLADAEPGAGG